MALGKLSKAYEGAITQGKLETLKEVFAGYEADLVEFVCSPLTGLPRLHKHPPDVADVIQALDGRRQHLINLAEAARRNERGVARQAPDHVSKPYVKPEYRDGEFVQVFVHEAAPQYAAMCERAETAERIMFSHVKKDGATYIGVPLSWIDQPVVREAKAWKSWTGDELLSHYATIEAGKHLHNDMFKIERHRREVERAMYQARYGGEGQQT